MRLKVLCISQLTSLPIWLNVVRSWIYLMCSFLWTFSVKWLNCFDFGTAFIYVYLHVCSSHFIRYKGLTIDLDIHVCKSMSICLWILPVSILILSASVCCNVKIDYDSSPSTSTTSTIRYDWLEHNFMFLYAWKNYLTLYNVRIL